MWWRCWPPWARRDDRWSGVWTGCWPTRSPTGRGSVGGGPTTCTAPGRWSRHWWPAGCRPVIRPSAGRWPGWRPTRTRTGAGERTCGRTTTRRRGDGGRRRRRRPPGRCWPCWPPPTAPPQASRRGPSRRASPSWWTPSWPTGRGTSRGSPAPGSPGTSTSTTTCTGWCSRCRPSGGTSGGRRRPASFRPARGEGRAMGEPIRELRVLLAAPRSFCAGVERAIEIVERALVRYGAPVYVRRQIVHNTHVVADLEAKGAVFVEELDEVPAGATVVLAAHGVSPEVRAQADRRGDLSVIDATCPLVAKVHHEARRFVSRGYDIALIGHAGHEEVVGTVGEAPDRIHLVEDLADVDALAPTPLEPTGVAGGAAEGDVRPMAFLTQTTLATDETAELVRALRDRFPDI